MVQAVVEGDPDAGDRDAAERALPQGRPESLLAGGDEFAGDAAAADLVGELEDALGQGFEPADDPGVLAGAAGLLLVRVVEVDGLADGLAIGDLGHAGPDLGPVFALHALDVDVEVELAHALDDGLVRFRIDVGPEGRVLLGEPVQGLGDAVGGGLVDGLDGQRDDRLGHVDRGHGQVEAGAAEGIARGAFDAEEGDNVARPGLGDLGHCVGVHADEPADLDLLARARVDDLLALAERALVDADVGQLAVGALLELEGQGDGLGGRVGGEDALFPFAVEVDGPVLDLGRIGQIMDDGVEERLDALVPVGRPDEDGDELAGQDAFADGGPDEVIGRPAPVSYTHLRAHETDSYL